MKPRVSAIILARNEAAMIANCIRTVGWCSEIIVIDDSSTDETAKKAESLGARVIKFSHASFGRKRNEALKHAQGEWLLYLDADERVTPTLAKEILVTMETQSPDAMRFSRENHLYGTHFLHGGWEHDTVTRVFKKTALKEWAGDIHESPVFTGAAVLLHSPLLHFTHRSTQENLRKSADWTKVEADLLYKAAVSPVTFWTLVRKGSMEFFRRAIVQKGYQDGLPGLIESLVQGMNRVMVYIQLWELQQKPPLPEAYRKKEQALRALWKNEKGL